ncbi:hypothetical protein BO78DRAFT_452034 [Aspergillus sclerotiicarbonarius CBS 121057]|uniref:Uncharacterized protein n=1 Tax=Aspergillus sclerotiicarbonarius (strain CBS 121057 / IBT 28362) TaxID=1448318 RepID=A0A319EHM0_ASPSB|nr:hypothetical protein BO78DRAFT_452034 [Aspergillus sclerotiicarbonarius CBS 121057]
MFFLLAFATLLSASALPLDHRPGYRCLPVCDATPRECACPSGTFFMNSTTWGTYPAPVEDLTDIIANYFDTAWFGTTPVETIGDPFTPGAKRVLIAQLPDSGKFPFTEELTTQDWLPDHQGLIQKYQMADAPFHYNTTSGRPGQLGGTWDLIDVHAVENGTYMLWNIYACFSAPYDFAAFHESGMKNISAILKHEGKMAGEMDGPYSY